MKTRPILFSAPMVRAILDGTKTQTRRVVKPQPSYMFGEGKHSKYEWKGGIFALDMYPNNSTILGHCPHGQIGDQIWVRETWSPDPPCDGTWNYTEWAGCSHGQIAGVPEQFRKSEFCNYRATWGYSDNYIWKPAIHMPRWASRITLEITGVRVERLNDISEEDALEEGCKRNHNDYFLGGPHKTGGRKQLATPKQAYRDLWESINGKGSWDLNPYVWVIEFKRVAA